MKSLFTLILCTILSSAAFAVPGMTQAQVGVYGACHAMDSTWTPQWANLIGYWKMDGNWNDSSGKGNNGTAVGGASFTASGTVKKIGTSAVAFNSGKGLNVGNVMTASYTKMAWVYPTGSSGTNIIGGGDDGLHTLWLAGCGTLRLSAGHNSSWGGVCDSAALSTNTWYHVAVSYDAATTTMRLFKNGVQVSSSTTVPPFTGGTSLRLGSFNSGQNSFSGTIDDIAVWNAALSPTEIQSVYSAQVADPTKSLDSSWAPQWAKLIGYWKLDGDLTDSSGNNRTAIAVGGAGSIQTANIRIGTDSGTFGGGVNIGSVLTASYTKATWVKVTASGGTGNIVGGGADGDHAFYHNGSSMRLSAGHNGGYTDVMDPATLSYGRWYHVAVTYNAASTTMRIYKDGIQVASSNAIPNFSGGSALRLGSFGSGANSLVGVMDETAVWNAVLTREEIKKIYDQQSCSQN